MTRSGSGPSTVFQFTLCLPRNYRTPNAQIENGVFARVGAGRPGQREEVFSLHQRTQVRVRATATTNIFPLRPHAQVLSYRLALDLMVTYLLVCAANRWRVCESFGEGPPVQMALGCGWILY